MCLGDEGELTSIVYNLFAGIQKVDDSRPLRKRIFRNSEECLGLGIM